ncbi:MAG TPA: hypothetical protein VH111_12655 [Steroidobacteraceae bacterium]|nr:hypothetical protein [Steroidobacteraceae bacterium]
MSDTAFIVTIDTEGDDLWSRPRVITTRNARFLPRFQSLCERFGFRPVYLSNYEMAMDDAFAEFGRDVITRRAGEIGMHLHAWNSPPLVPLTDDDFLCQPYLIEYPDDLMREKIRFMTGLLTARFGEPPVSHRSGRLGFDGRYAAMLLEHGYRVDCSVSPGIDWSTTPGVPGGRGGTDFRGFPHRPYFLRPGDIAAPAANGLLEVPITIETSRLFERVPWLYRSRLIRGVANRISPRHSWLAPAENGLRCLRRAARGARARGASYLQLTLHSSELMPGGSPTFRTAEAIERLYETLEILFEELATWCRGMTLNEFHARISAQGAARRDAAEVHEDATAEAAT